MLKPESGEGPLLIASNTSYPRSIEGEEQAVKNLGLSDVELSISESLISMRTEDLFYFILPVQMFMLIDKAFCWPKQKSGLVDKHHPLLVILWKEKKTFKFFPLPPLCLEAYQQNTRVMQEKEEILAVGGLSRGEGTVWQLQETK